MLKGFDLEAIKTKEFVAVLNNLGAVDCLVVIPAADLTVEKSGRNVPRVKVLRAEGLNVYDILKHDRLLLLEGAVAGIEEALS